MASKRVIQVRSTGMKRESGGIKSGARLSAKQQNCNKIELQLENNIADGACNDCTEKDNLDVVELSGIACEVLAEASTDAGEDDSGSRMVGEKAGSATVLTFAIDELAIEKIVSNVEGREVAFLIPKSVQNKLTAKL